MLFDGTLFRVGLFKERKTKFLLLSLLSAAAVISIAFVGFPIYAQTDGSNSTNTTSTAAAPANASEQTTSTADVQALLNGLIICDLGTTTVSGQTATASVGNASQTTPTVSVKVMTETQVAGLSTNKTETASADNKTSTASASCVELGGANQTSPSASNVTGTNTTTTGNNTTTSGSDVTATANAASASPGTSNKTSISSVPESNRQILVVNGKDFEPGQAVLILSQDRLLAIDDVASDGTIDVKVLKPETGQTTTASNNTSNNIELRFVETGTHRSGSFGFNGQTLTAATGGEINAEGAVTAQTATPSANASSTNSTNANSMKNSGSSSTPQY